MKRFWIAATLLIAAASSALAGSGTDLTKHDFVWDKVERDYYNSALLGNGISGAAIMGDEKNPHAVRWSLSRMDIIAHHIIEELEYCDNRLMAGSILLDPIGKPKQRTMRLDLFNGEASGEILSDQGSASWTSFIDRKYDVIVVAVEGREGEKEIAPIVRPEWGISPIFELRKERENYDPLQWLDQLPPKPIHIKTRQGPRLIKQPLTQKGAYAIAYVTQQEEEKTVLYVAMSTAYNPQNERDEDVEKASINALQRMEAARNEGYAAMRKRNTEWWNDYMLQSALDLPNDPYWETFWWRQVYKFGACSNGENAYLIDNEGAWAWHCAWGAIWWNLNVQLSYFPAYSANRLKVGRSLINGINRIYHSGAFHQNAREILNRPDVNDAIAVGRGTTQWGNKAWGNELGNLTWALHNVWRHWRYSMNQNIADALFKWLTENVNFYRYRMIEQDDGSIHLPPTRSPEYYGKAEMQDYPDTNYALQSFDWALGALIDLNDRYAYNHPLRAEWERIRNNLTPFPKNKNGWKINAIDGYDQSHRHYSHMLAFYPYHTVDPTKDRVCATTLKRWTSMEEKFTGYSYTGSSAMFSTLGDGKRALEQLDKLKPKLTPNTLYREGGGPVIETPLSGVETINYFMLQSWGGVIRAFPALPKRWKEGSFENLRAEGAFLVSGEWKKGKPVSLSIKSLAGEPLVLEPGFNAPLKKLKITGGTLKKIARGRYRVDLKKGDTLHITRK